MLRQLPIVGLLIYLTAFFLSACTAPAKVANQNPAPPAKNQINRPSRESLDNALRQNSGTRVELTNPEPLEEGRKKP
jgi:PBP1b-binding outer membrane lipoprotein LpoB